MSRTRVLVVEDSVTVRRRLCEVLASDSDLEVAAEAENGQRAIELCRELRPDVVTMDMVMPVMTGLAATEYIMAYCPTPILVISASHQRGELFRTYDALAAGAVDVLDKPRGDELAGEWEQRLLAAVKLVSRIKVISHPRARLEALGRKLHSPPAPCCSAATAGYRLVALGASTGGPAAIVEILKTLPPRFPLPILLVIHIGEAFGLALAEWLDTQSDLGVAYARGGEDLADLASRVVMAPPGRHLAVQRGRLQLNSDPERYSCRPSVDVLFESVAREYGPASVACLLTGIGRDGAAGLLQVRRAGGLTIAQDETSSVVYGMPKEAVALGAAARVLSLREIAATLARIGAPPPEEKSR